VKVSHLHSNLSASRRTHMLRHTYVTTMLDAGVSLRDVQIAARHADPRTTMRYDRARKNLDRHPNYVLAAYMTAGA
jgi:integrase/recombinase XerD